MKNLFKLTYEYILVIFKGMKFALLEAKVALVKILKNFEIHSTQNTDLQYIEGVVRSPKNGVKIMLKKR